MIQEISVKLREGEKLMLLMPRDIGADLARALRLYNDYRISFGLDRDSGWAEVAIDIDRELRKAQP